MKFGQPFIAQGAATGGCPYDGGGGGVELDGVMSLPYLMNFFLKIKKNRHISAPAFARRFRLFTLRLF
jgi:hypothetical protein